MIWNWQQTSSPNFTWDTPQLRKAEAQSPICTSNRFIRLKTAMVASVAHSPRKLAQSLARPTLVALAATILARRKSYYAALEVANKDNTITSWLRWFADTAIEAQARTVVYLEFLLDKTRLFDRLRDALNDRQQRALLRVLREGPAGFTGGLSARNYITITGASPATATRDLSDLVERGVLLRTGERRHTRYTLATPQRVVPRVRIDDSGTVHVTGAASAAPMLPVEPN